MVWIIWTHRQKEKLKARQLRSWEEMIDEAEACDGSFSSSCFERPKLFGWERHLVGAMDVDSALRSSSRVSRHTWRFLPRLAPECPSDACLLCALICGAQPSLIATAPSGGCDAAQLEHPKQSQGFSHGAPAAADVQELILREKTPYRLRRRQCCLGVRWRSSARQIF